MLHVQLNQKFYLSDAYGIFHQYIQIIDDILEEGKRDGSVRKEVNNRIFKNLFLGAFCHMALRWLMLGKEQGTDKTREIDEVVSLLCRAVSNSESDNI